MDLPTLAILAAAAVATSCVSAIVGMLGGIILLVTMLAVLDGSVSYVAVIYVHGVAQLISNTVRALAYGRHIHWKTCVAHACGAVAAAPVGYLLLRELLAGDEARLRLLFGLFVLTMTWAPPKRVLGWLRGEAPAPTFTGEDAQPYRRRGWLHLWPMTACGALVGGVTFFFGATGPLIAPFFQNMGFLKEPLIATKATVQAWTHLLKTVLLSAGVAAVATGPSVSLVEHAPLVLVLVPGVVLGTFLGKRVQRHVSAALFVKLFRAALTVAALHLIYRGATG